MQCDLCEEVMVLRDGKRGRFYGCTNYPQCKGTKPYESENVVLIKGTPEQEDIFTFVQKGQENGIISARAGVGKTFCIVESLKRLRGSKVGVFSFNTHIIKEMNEQLQNQGISWARGNTYNSFGYRWVKSHFEKAELFQDKLQTLLNELLPGTDEESFAVRIATERLVRLCKCYMEDGDNESILEDLVDKFNIEVGGDFEETERRMVKVFALVPRALEACLKRRSTLDFDDQIWWVVKLGLPVEQYDMVFIDEAQDTNRMQQELVKMACPSGRIFVIGDEKQAIHGFRGSDIEAFRSFQSALNSRINGCKNFPLSVCRRCPKSHIRLAQALVSDIKWMTLENSGIEAPEGEIYQLGQDAALGMMQEGDMGLSRVNKVLIPAAFALIKMRKKVIIRGRDIGVGLSALIKKMKAKTINELLNNLAKWYDKEVKKICSREGVLDPSLLTKNVTKFQALQDKVGCIEALCDGVDTLAELNATISTLFADFDDAGKPKKAIVLGTVHRTKGLEAPNITVLDPQHFPHPLAKKSWERMQEVNLAYVSCTRAKFSSHEPGRLTFIGKCPGLFKAGWLEGKQKYPGD